LKLNLTKSQEIIIADRKRKEKFPVAAKTSELQRVEVIKILDVTVTKFNGLSVSPLY